jgi:hypothetical protein
MSYFNYVDYEYITVMWLPRSPEAIVRQRTCGDIVAEQAEPAEPREIGQQMVS